MTNSWHKIIIINVIILAILTGLVIFGILPQINIHINDKAKYIQKNEELNTTEKHLTALRQAQKEMEQNNKVYETVSNLWPDKEEVSKFIVQIEGLATENNTLLKNVTIAEADNNKTNSNQEESSSSKKGSTENGINFSFDLSSSYKDTYNLILGLEKLARFNSVTSLNMSTNASDNNKLDVKIGGYIYGK